jgi:VIT1/CCC1 family predicted Fe2+/Mn2+ transporter/rubrerythrin
LTRDEKILTALKENWDAETRGNLTYAALSERETDPVRAQILMHLANAEKVHAELWANRIRELGGAEPIYSGSKHGDADTLANRVGGVKMALRRLEIDESRAIANYGKQLSELGDEPSVAILKHVIEEEKEHYRELSSLIRDHYPHDIEGIKVDPKAMIAELLSRRGKSGKQAAGWIGDAIYGVNDGLGAIFGIVSGVSGATINNPHGSQLVLLAGLAGTIASALSMGSGAYLAAKSEREIYEAEIAREREAITMNGSEARELLSLYYQLKGLPEQDAANVVDHIAKDPNQMLRALTSERLNLTEEALSNPWVSAFSGMASTAVGAFVPLIPFFFLQGIPAVLWAAGISLAAHFAVGAAKSLITVRTWWSSGIEMTAIGALEGLITYFLGVALGGLA